MSITQVRRNLGAVIDEVVRTAEPIMIVNHGKPVAAIVDLEDLYLIWMAEDELENGPMDFDTGDRPGRETWREMRHALAQFGQYLSKTERVQVNNVDLDRRSGRQRTKEDVLGALKERLLREVRG